MSDHVFPLATATAPYDTVTAVPTTSVPADAWADPEYRREYKKAYRGYVLADLTSDPRGWSVRWSLRTIADDGTLAD